MSVASDEIVSADTFNGMKKSLENIASKNSFSAPTISTFKSDDFISVDAVNEIISSILDIDNLLETGSCQSCESCYGCQSCIDCKKGCS